MSSGLPTLPMGWKTLIPWSVPSILFLSGTHFKNFDLLPAIGYQRNRELNDAVLRKKYKLVARPAIPSLYDSEARKKPFSTDNTTFEAIVGTAKDEVAVAPGNLQKPGHKETAPTSTIKRVRVSGASTPSYQGIMQ